MGVLTKASVSPCSSSCVSKCTVGATSAKHPPPAGLGTSLASRKLGAAVSSETSGVLKHREVRKLSLLASRRRVVRASVEELDVPLVTSNDPVDQQQGSSLLVAVESDPALRGGLSGFSPESPLTFDLSTAAATGGTASTGNEAQIVSAAAGMYRPKLFWFATSEEQERQYLDRAVNAAVVTAAGMFAVTKILTVDHDYWHGWTMFEILKYAPLHNWSAYEAALKNNPVLAKMMISGTVYSIGDWIAQCCEGKPIFDFNRGRMIRSGLVGFCLHGSLSHFYYQFCEMLFPFKGWWVVPVKVAFDQTIWAAFWNSIYFVTVGLLRLDSPQRIGSELKSTFWPMLTAGWKLWPFAHVITYGVMPVEQRLLWVDCVELIWVMILSMYCNEKAEARMSNGATSSPATLADIAAVSVETESNKDS